MTDTEIRAEIIENMAKALFACAWASYSEEIGPHYAAGSEILDVMPEEIDPAARKAADDLAARMEARYGGTLPELLERAKARPHRYADRPCDAEHFGHYAAMHAMGTGVGLERVCDRAAFPEMPRVEFHYLDLDEDTYPVPEEGTA